MQTEPVETLLSRLDAAHAPTRRSTAHASILAFDADGTLWTGDVAEDFFHVFSAHGDIRPPAHRGAIDLATSFGVETDGTPDELVRRLFRAYIDDRVPEHKICELISWCAAGWTRSELASFERGVLEKTRMESRLQDETMRALAWGKERGIEIFVVSASPHFCAAPALAPLGIDADHIVAVTPVYENDIVQPRVVQPVPYGVGKVHALRERVGSDRVVLAAFGDNVFDIPLLQEAQIPVAVRPKPKLRARASEVDGIVELIS